METAGTVDHLSPFPCATLTPTCYYIHNCIIVLSQQLLIPIPDKPTRVSSQIAHAQKNCHYRYSSCGPAYRLVSGLVAG